MFNNSLSTIHFSILSNNQHLVISVQYQCNTKLSEYFFASFTMNDLLLLHSAFNQYTTIHSIQSHLTQYITLNNNNILCTKSNNTLLLTLKDFINHSDITLTLHLCTHTNINISSTLSNNTTSNTNNKRIPSKSIIYIINIIHIILLLSLTLFVYYLILSTHISFESSIATPNDFKRISKWINPSKHFTYTLLYKATRDGDLARNFHNKCDNRGTTLTLVKTVEGWIFGGHTTCAWQSGVNRYEKCEDVFMFSLSLLKKYPFNYKGSNVIVNLDYKGPTFGFGYDMSISDKCLSRENTCYSPSSFIGGDEVNEFNGKKNTFIVKELEVYTIEEGK